VRVSTEQQRADGSHNRQREQLRSWAQREGHDLELFEDIAISGQSDKGPEYGAMMQQLDEFDRSLCASYRGSEDRCSVSSVTSTESTAPA